MAGLKQISRRGVVRTLARVGTALSVVPLLSNCGGVRSVSTPISSLLPTGVPPGSSPPSAADVIMLIRHAEKPTGAGSPTGVTADGRESAGSLTVSGWTRAGALVGLFAPAHGEPPAGLVRPTVVWAADPRGDEGQRPQQTVTPLAARLGVAVNTRFGKGQEADLATQLIASHGNALVAWQHQELPAIIAHLGQVTPMPPPKWPGERYDLVWVFARNGSGWYFTQVPQLLLAGDRPDSIV